MPLDQTLVVIIAAATILGIYWFFLGKRIARPIKVTGDIEIIVEGGYTPESIEVPVGVPTTLHFFRKDPSSCLEEVVISDLKIRRPLALNERTDITITPSRVGTLPFTCGMGMFHGTIIVK